MYAASIDSARVKWKVILRLHAISFMTGNNRNVFLLHVNYYIVEFFWIFKGAAILS